MKLIHSIVKRIVRITGDWPYIHNYFSTYVERILHESNNSGYLHKKGWSRSAEERTACDMKGNPLPWMSYPFIDFIKERLNKQMSVLEFGSGQSTLFFASRVAHVVSIEHDLEWKNLLTSKLPDNVELIWVQLERNGEYCRSGLSTKKLFDIIVIDGRDRVNCTLNSISILNDNGVIILDDSERVEYYDIFTRLNQDGFKSISFSGMSPGLPDEKITTVFYRQNNCLDI